MRKDTPLGLLNDYSKTEEVVEVVEESFNNSIVDLKIEDSSLIYTKGDNTTKSLELNMASDLTPSSVLISDSSGKIVASSITSTELSYLDGATDSIQEQLNNKASTVIASTTQNGLMTSDMVKKLNGIEEGATSQNTFSAITVGSTTISADTPSDTVTLVAGENVTLTPDATNDKITIAAKDTTYTLSSFGVSATAAELNYTDGVTSNIQTQLNSKAANTNFVKSGSGAKAGLVPAPSTTAGTTKYLREDGTWVVPPDTNTTYSVATTSVNGLMSSTDKTNLNSAIKSLSVSGKVITYTKVDGSTGTITTQDTDTDTDTKVTQTVTTTNAEYPLLAAATASKTATSTEAARFAAAVKLNPSTGKITATAFAGNGASITNLNMANAASGTLAVGRGGTGITSNPSILTNLGSTAAASVFAASPRPGITGTLPIANGGTGATTAQSAAYNLQTPFKIFHNTLKTYCPSITCGTQNSTGSNGSGFYINATIAQLCAALPMNSVYENVWTGSMYVSGDFSAGSGYRFGTIGKELPSVYGRLIIDKSFGEATCRVWFYPYDSSSVYYGLYEPVNDKGWKGFSLVVAAAGSFSGTLTYIGAVTSSSSVSFNMTGHKGLYILGMGYYASWSGTYMAQPVFLPTVLVNTGYARYIPIYLQGNSVDKYTSFWLLINGTTISYSADSFIEYSFKMYGARIYYID